MNEQENKEQTWKTRRTKTENLGATREVVHPPSLAKLLAGLDGKQSVTLPCDLLTSSLDLGVEFEGHAELILGFLDSGSLAD